MKTENDLMMNAGYRLACACLPIIAISYETLAGWFYASLGLMCLILIAMLCRGLGMWKQQSEKPSAVFSWFVGNLLALPYCTLLVSILLQARGNASDGTILVCYLISAFFFLVDILNYMVTLRRKNIAKG